jgi:hypothetical protein
MVKEAESFQAYLHVLRVVGREVNALLDAEIRRVESGAVRALLGVTLAPHL